MKKTVLIAAFVVMLTLCAAGSALAHPYAYGYAAAYYPAQPVVAVPTVVVHAAPVVYYAPVTVSVPVVAQPCAYHYYPAPRVLNYARPVNQMQVYPYGAYIYR